jgi:E3 ubiquitin-protein ligase synoviolin
MASALNSVAKYVLSCIELRRARTRGGETAPPWEDKSVWNFYIELTTGMARTYFLICILKIYSLDFLKLTTYLLFFVIVVAAYGIPLNIVRDVYMTARSFVMRLRAFHRYRSATRDMDARYPNATDADLPASSDRTCIICREEMIPTAIVEGAAGRNLPIAQDGPNMTPKKLPCGHIFHFQCLRSWLERQQSCPTW